MLVLQKYACRLEVRSDELSYERRRVTEGSDGGIWLCTAQTRAQGLLEHASWSKQDYGGEEDERKTCQKGKRGCVPRDRTGEKYMWPQYMMYLKKNSHDETQHHV